MSYPPESLAQWCLRIPSGRGDMPLEVTTNDAVSLTDADLDEMGSMEGAFDIGAISKAKEDWVLATIARIERPFAARWTRVRRSR